jgi:hypothetical protein
VNRRATITVAAALLAATACAPGLAAQATPTVRASQDASMRLHAAWLREALDLDVRGAVADYQAIANDRQSRLVRWIAVARLGELQRIGVPVGDLGPVAAAPQPIKDALATLNAPLPHPVEQLLQQAAAGAGAEPPSGAEPAPPFELRPAVPVALRYVLSEVGPNATERQRQRMLAIGAQRSAAARAAETPAGERERDEERDYANLVLRMELEGRTATAASQRTLFFPDWKPMPLAGEPAALLARVRSNLDGWLKEQNLGQRQRTLLTRLREDLQTRAAADTGAALQFVARLPWYGERLLAEPPPDTNK